jgi:hypothetical protein
LKLFNILDFSVNGESKSHNFIILFHYCPVKAGKSVFEIVET